MVTVRNNPRSSGKLAKICIISLVGLAVPGLVLGTATVSDASVPRSETVLRANAAAIQNNLSALQKQQAAERDAAHSELELPRGYEFSAPLAFPEVEAQSDRFNKLSGGVELLSLQQVPEAETSVYEDGYFESIAAIDWQCAWLDVAVTAAEHGDQARVQDAVTRLDQFQDSRLVDAFPDYPLFLSDYVHPVLDGQLSNARSFLADGCTLAARP